MEMLEQDMNISEDSSTSLIDNRMFIDDLCLPSAVPVRV